MQVVPTTIAMRPWTAAHDEKEALFGYVATFAAPGATPLPRVWPGRGLVLPAMAVPGLTAALAAVLPTAHDATAAAGHRAAENWARPRLDPRDRYVYLDGPVARWNGGLTYQPTCVLTLARTDLEGLHTRLRETATHLVNSAGGF